MKAGERGLWLIFRWPLLLGSCSAAGLLAALVGDEAWDVASWALLGAPVAVCLLLMRRLR